MPDHAHRIELSAGPAAVSELAAPFDMSLPSFVQPPGGADRRQLVKSRKRGRVRTYELVPDRFRVAEGARGESPLRNACPVHEQSPAANPIVTQWGREAVARLGSGPS